MGRWLKGQVIAGTNEDSHGETYSREFFQDFVDAAPKRMSLNVGHDLSEPPVGYLTNFRLVEGSTPGHYLLLADIWLESGAVPAGMTGFSWSRPMLVKSNVPNPRIRIYLPYPFYKDPAEIDRLLSGPEPVGVGKWIRKEFDTQKVALVVAAVAIFLQPVVEVVFEQDVYPALKAQFRRLRDLWRRGFETELVLFCFGHAEDRIKVHFFSRREDGEEAFAAPPLKRALVELDAEAHRIFMRDGIGLREARFRFDPPTRSYALVYLEESDGRVLRLEHLARPPEGER